MSSVELAMLFWVERDLILCSVLAGIMWENDPRQTYQ